jgi:hypothetical protein
MRAKKRKNEMDAGKNFRAKTLKTGGSRNNGSERER